MACRKIMSMMIISLPVTSDALQATTCTCRYLAIPLTNYLVTVSVPTLPKATPKPNAPTNRAAKATAEKAKPSRQNPAQQLQDNMMHDAGATRPTNEAEEA